MSVLFKKSISDKDLQLYFKYRDEYYELIKNNTRIWSVIFPSVQSALFIIIAFLIGKSDTTFLIKEYYNRQFFDPVVFLLVIISELGLIYSVSVRANISRNFNQILRYLLYIILLEKTIFSEKLINLDQYYIQMINEVRKKGNIISPKYSLPPYSHPLVPSDRPSDKTTQANILIYGSLIIWLVIFIISSIIFLQKPLAELIINGIF